MEDIIGKISFEDITNKRAVTKMLRAQVTDEKLWAEVWKFCKKLAAFSHAPVSLKEYLRMKEYAKNEPLVKEIYNMLLEYGSKQDNGSELSFDIIGYFYCIALISQAEWNRKSIIEMLNNKADEVIKDGNNAHGKLLYRNMYRLGKLHPDLMPIERKLKVFV